jgi:phenylacetate-coenzyme A ligase PaaK-like adenylate-forming protein
LTRERDRGLHAHGKHVEVALADGGTADLCRRIASEIIARCELRPAVEVVAPGTLPKTEFKAKRVRDLRPS